MQKTFLPAECNEQSAQKLFKTEMKAKGLLEKTRALLKCLESRETVATEDFLSRQKLQMVSYSNNIVWKISQVKLGMQLIVSATKAHSQSSWLYESIRYSELSNQGHDSLQALMAAIETE